MRGTPQQIIEKYLSLSHDAQMAGDRIGSENFAQHAEHYARLLGAAQREIAERREAMEAQRKQSEPQPQEAEAPAKPAKREAQHHSEPSEQPTLADSDIFSTDDGHDDSTLVQTPENAEKKPVRKAAPRKRKTAPKPSDSAEQQPASSEESVIN